MSTENQNADCVALLGLLAWNADGKEAEDRKNEGWSAHRVKNTGADFDVSRLEVASFSTEVTGDSSDGVTGLLCKKTLARLADEGW